MVFYLEYGIKIITILKILKLTCYSIVAQVLKPGSFPSVMDTKIRFK